MVKKATTSKMDLANRALCFALRNPPKGHKKVARILAKPIFLCQPDVVGFCFESLVLSREYFFKRTADFIKGNEILMRQLSKVDEVVQ